MIYITGDLHGAEEIHKLIIAAFPEQRQLCKDDFLIICGDFGLVWSGDSEEKHWLKWLDDKSFTTLFVDGNHENHKMLGEFPVSEFCGGRTHRISGSVFHLMRGDVYTFFGKKFFAMGGAESHDRAWRAEDVSWWPEELPDFEEYENVVKKKCMFDKWFFGHYHIDGSVDEKYFCLYNAVKRVF